MPTVSPSAPTMTSGTGNQIVVSPYNKKLNKFARRRTEGEQSVQDFVKELKTTFKAREMTAAK